MNLTWADLAEGLSRQVNFTEGYSPLYHALYQQMAAWALARAEGGPLDLAGAAFCQTLEAAWAERALGSWLEASLLLPAAIHAALLNAEPAAAGLRPLYATLGGQFDPAQDGPALLAGLGDLFGRGGETLDWFLREGRVQTNEITRGLGWLLPAYQLQAWFPELSFTLVDFGCSAGLNLSADWQAWAWDYQGQQYPAGQSAQAQATPLHQTLHTDDPRDPDLGQLLPQVPRLNIQQRIGFDRHPLDVHHSEARLMLQACIWGDQPGRMAQLEQAIAGYLAMESAGGAPRYYAGELMQAAALLPRLISADTPRPHLLLIFNSAVTVYFSDLEYHDLKGVLMGSFAALPIGIRGLWLEAESPRYNESIERPKHFLLSAKMPFLSGISTLHLAEMEAHPRNFYARPNWSLLRDLLS